jgi:hypothetical protein
MKVNIKLGIYVKYLVRLFVLGFVMIGNYNYYRMFQNIQFNNFLQLHTAISLISTIVFILWFIVLALKGRFDNYELNFKLPKFIKFTKEV